MKFELWKEDDGYTFSTPENIKNMWDRGIMTPGAKKAWEIEADLWEEACTAYHEYMGWEPYVPMTDED